MAFHQVYDVIWCQRIHFSRIGIRHAKHVSCKLNDHALHAETYSESRDIIFAAPPYGRQLSLYTPLPETRSYNHPVKIREHTAHVSAAHFLGIDIHQIQFPATISGGLYQRFIDRLVCILQLDILSDQTDTNLIPRSVKQTQELVPGIMVRFISVFSARKVKHQLIKMLTVHHRRHMINR